MEVIYRLNNLKIKYLIIRREQHPKYGIIWEVEYGSGTLKKHTREEVDRVRFNCMNARTKRYTTFDLYTQRLRSWRLKCKREGFTMEHSFEDN
jgi:hypothetical protein